jgi:hypothetical protein
MGKPRWIQLENVLIADFRPRYRGLKLPIPPRTVYGRRSRRIGAGGSILAPQDVGRIRAVGSRYKKQRLRPYMRSLAVLPLPDSGPTCPEPFSGFCEGPALNSP